MTTELVVQTEKLTKEYRSFFRRRTVCALRDLDLQVARGEILGLMGPNGSGKTTTVKLLLGLSRPTRGRALVLGRHAADVSTNGRIGFLPEESYFYPFLNAGETLDFYGRLFGMPRRTRKREIDRLIGSVGLEAHRRRPLREYSKGMLRRIGLAQSLINDPELLLLDEPTSGLDPIGAADIKELLLELKSRGKTILSCSHLMADVEGICDRVGILNDGCLIKIGPAEELLAVRDSLQLRLRNVNARFCGELDAFLREKGAEVEDVSPAPIPLDALFVQAIREAAEAVEGGVDAGTEDVPGDGEAS